MSIKITLLVLFFGPISSSIYPSLSCSKLSESESKPVFKSDSSLLDCGIEQVSKRIVGGIEVAPNRYRWIAAITDRALKTIMCGATLINNRYVLTAGHCFNTLSKNTFRVVLGLHDMGKMRNVTVYYPEKIIIHEKYETDSAHQRWDLALIRLDRNVTYTDMIQPVCLPPRNFVRDFDNLVVAGWGALGDDMGQPVKLLEAPVPQRSLEECKSLLTSFRITEDHICAGNRTR